MLPSQKDVWGRCEQLVKVQTELLETFSQYTFVALAKVENTQITETVSDILNNLVRLCFVQDKLISLLSEMLYQLYKALAANV